MPRLLWIVSTAVVALALTGYLVAKPFDTQEPPVAPASNTVKPAQITSPTPSPELPVTQVILYSSGVGYFQRDGQVDGNARIDLAFPVQGLFLKRPAQTSVHWVDSSSTPARH